MNHDSNSSLSAATSEASSSQQQQPSGVNNISTLPTTTTSPSVANSNATTTAAATTTSTTTTATTTTTTTDAPLWNNTTNPKSANAADSDATGTTSTSATTATDTPKDKSDKLPDILPIDTSATDASNPEKKTNSTNKNSSSPRTPTNTTSNPSQQQQHQPPKIHSPCLILHFQSCRLIYGIIDKSESLCEKFIDGKEDAELRPREIANVVALRRCGDASNEEDEMMADDDDSAGDDASLCNATHSADDYFQSDLSQEAVKKLIQTTREKRKQQESEKNGDATVDSETQLSTFLKSSVVLKSKKEAPADPTKSNNKDTSMLEGNTSAKSPPSMLFGQDAIDAVHDASNPHFTSLIRPMRYGHIQANNLHQLQTHLDILFSFLQHVCYTELKLTRSQITKMPVVYIAPEDITDTELHCMVDLLLCRLSFQRVMIHNDLALSAFGCGLNHVCVCQIGDTKTSVACVNDGECPKPQHISVGINDMANMLGRLLTKEASWPVENFSLSDPVNQEKLRELFLQHASVGYKEKMRTVQFIHNKQVYEMEMCDPLRVATMSILFPNMHHPFRKSLHSVCAPRILHYWSDFHAQSVQDILTELNRRRFQAINSGGTVEIPVRKTRGRKSKQWASGGNPMESGILTLTQDTKEKQPQDTSNIEQNVPAIDASVKFDSLEQLIINSFKDAKAKLKTTRRKKKILVVNVLFCGLGAQIEGLKKYMNKNLQKHFAKEYEDHTVEVNIEDNGAHPNWLPWRGAVLLSRTEAAQSMWIDRGEFTAHGNKILLEKMAYIPSGFQF